MPVDPSVINALEAALAHDAANTELTLHLAALLVESDASRALALAQQILTVNPTELRALEIAAHAAAAAGNGPLADQYRLVTRSIGGAAPSASEDEEEQDEPSETSNVVRLHAVDGDLSDDFGYALERPRITLDDVGGLDAVKKRLNQAFLGPLRNPELRATFGKSLRGGLLLFGPPGCGKTYIARAVAGEVGARFLGIGLSDVLDIWIGASERNLHELFETARRNAPCVLFIDEIDALGQKRGNMRNANAMRNVVSQLLAELDGAAEDNEGVFLLGATNHPWDVDSALRRPGRFDRTLLVLPPDEPARVAILAHHMAGRPIDGNLDLAKVAKRTEGLSGADLAAVCETATEFALTDSIESGRVRHISNGDLAEAVKAVRPSTKAWFDLAYNYAMFANDGGQYDELLGYIRQHKLR